MTIKEAIEVIEYARAFNEDNSPLMYAWSLAITASAKQIPTAPIGRHTDYRCAVCGRRVRSGKGSSSRVRDNYCQKCGQKLLWEETNG